MAGFGNEENDSDEQPEVPSTMLFGKINADIFDTIYSRVIINLYFWICA